MQDLSREIIEGKSAKIVGQLKNQIELMKKQIENISGVPYENQGDDGNEEIDFGTIPGDVVDDIVFLHNKGVYTKICPYFHMHDMSGFLNMGPFMNYEVVFSTKKSPMDDEEEDEEGVILRHFVADDIDRVCEIITNVKLHIHNDVLLEDLQSDC